VLQGALGDALAAFFEVLDRLSLADLIRPKRRLSALLRLHPAT
jgi:DNA-binding IscR family transcriptional regulator